MIVNSLVTTTPFDGKTYRVTEIFGEVTEGQTNIANIACLETGLVRTIGTAQLEPVVTTIAGYNVEEHEFLIMPGYDHCIIGVDEVTYRVCYDSEKVIEENMKQGMTREEAQEHFSFNQSGAFVGSQTPIFISVGGAE